MNTVRNLFILSFVLGSILAPAAARPAYAEDSADADLEAAEPVAAVPEPAVKKPAKAVSQAAESAAADDVPGEPVSKELAKAEPAKSDSESSGAKGADAVQEKPSAAKAEKSKLKTFNFTGLLHLTGDLAAEGKAFEEGIELAADDAKEELAAAGKAVDVIFDDTGYDLAKTNTVAARALSDDTVTGIFVSTLHEMKAIGASVERGHMPAIVLWDSSPELEDMGDYIFSVGPWAPDVGRKAADFVEKTLSAHSAFVISTNNEWSNAASKSFFDETLKNGADMVGSESLNPEDRDFLGILAKIRSTRAEAVYVPLATNLMTFAKQVVAGGIKTPMISSDVINEQLIKDSRGAFEGYYQTMTTAPEGPGAEKLKSLYEKRYGKTISNLTLTALGYDAMKLYIHAILGGAATRDAVKDALAKAKDVPGAFGAMTMSEKGSVSKFVSVYQIKGGQFTLVEKADGTSSR